MRVSRYVLQGSQLQLSGGAVQPVFSTRSAELRFIDSRDWDLITAGQLDLVETTDLTRLFEESILVDDDEDELGVIVAENREDFLGEVLEQVVMPTRNCQLGCGYCGQEHRPHSMNAEQQNQLVDRLRVRIEEQRRCNPRLAVLRVGWFGAEPLLAMDVIRSLTPRLVDLAKVHGLKYAAHIVTNGFGLSADVATELVNVHAVEQVEITLDGMAATHDDRRPTKSGRGTFARIFENLLATARLDLPQLMMSVRCNVDANNAHAVTDLLNHLRDSGLQNRVRLSFSPVYDWGNDAGSKSLDADTYGAAEAGWLALADRLGFDVQMLPGRRTTVCIAASGGGVVTDAEGSEYSCTEAPYVASYGEPTNSFSVPVRLSTGRTGLPFRDFVDRVSSGSQSECNSCPMYPVCGGACPKAWSDGQVPCPSFKSNYRTRIDLAAAQQLRAVLTD